MPTVRQILQSHAANRILRETSHTPRAEDEPLAAELEKKHILWLTGRSLSGKTHAGQSIAQRLQDLGIECLETDDLKEARAFLAPGELHTRLVLLDDPLLLAPHPMRMWEAVVKFAQVLPSQHRLIVTAKLEQLKKSLIHRLSRRARIFSVAVGTTSPRTIGNSLLRTGPT